MSTFADKIDHTPLTKGKYKGKTPDEISEIDPSYVVWAYENWLPRPCSRLLADACREDKREHNDYDEDGGLDEVRFHSDLD